MKKTRKQLEQELIDLKLQQHKDKYIHIPKVNLIPLIGLIFFGILSYLNLKLLDWEIISLVFNCVGEECKNISASALINIYPIIGEYILISLALISLVAIFKGGYNQIKSYNERGLIFGLIASLVFGLIGSLIDGLIAGLVFGLIAGLVFGLIAGLVFGLIGEFG